MSSDPVISVKNLSKCYQIYRSPVDRLQQMLMRGRKQFYKEFWALRDVSFTVGRGETVGIVGQNGCGKSTLLQMICGTLNPTSGTCQTKGRIAALLELGSGFNPEFTGRENVYMNGSILGLSSEEIDSRFKTIADFAAIGEFVERPVKTYSSGMMVRLAFAVAINVDPEILVVDEALAVGDELFQRKCFSRIEAMRKQGATILFVSHSVGTILELCDRAIMLDGGEKLAENTPKYITGRYQKLIYAPADKREKVRETIIAEELERDSGQNCPMEKSTHHKEVAEKEVSLQKESFDPELVPTSTVEYLSHGVIISKPEIWTEKGVQVNTLIRGRTYRYRYCVNFSNFATCVNFGMMIKSVSGVELGGASSGSQMQPSLSSVTAGTVYQIEFSFHCSLNPGVYFLNAGVTGEVKGEMGFLHRLLDVAMFRVQPEEQPTSTGMVDFSCLAHFHPVS